MFISDLVIKQLDRHGEVDKRSPDSAHLEAEIFAGEGGTPIRGLVKDEECIPDNVVDGRVVLTLEEALHRRVVDHIDQISKTSVSVDAVSVLVRLLNNHACDGIV